MTSANDGSYVGQYPCDGRVDNLEPTLLLAINCFRSLKKTIKELPTTRKKSYFVLK